MPVARKDSLCAISWEVDWDSKVTRRWRKESEKPSQPWKGSRRTFKSLLLSFCCVDKALKTKEFAELYPGDSLAKEAHSLTQEELDSEKVSESPQATRSNKSDKPCGFTDTSSFSVSVSQQLPRGRLAYKAFELELPSRTWSKTWRLSSAKKRGGSRATLKLFAGSWIWTKTLWKLRGRLMIRSKTTTHWRWEIPAPPRVY